MRDFDFKASWIPVDDNSEMPKDNEYVLLSFDNFSVPMVGRYERKRDGGGSFYLGDDEESCLDHTLFVNAWMPLPNCFEPLKGYGE